MGENVFSFHEGIHLSKAILGGKGKSLADMTVLGLNVPSGFTITTTACNAFYKNNEKLWKALEDEIIEALKELEHKIGKRFGDKGNPLLVSVRSGSIISMPGMMDTILNLGLNDETVIALGSKTKNMRFAYDSYRRFIEMFSTVVMGIPHYKFEYILESIKEKKNYQSDLELTTEDLRQIVEAFKLLYQDEIKEEFPVHPIKQLFHAIEAVFKSWNNKRAVIYRNIHEIRHDLGTAVNVQAMVFGNMGVNSGTGVVFTRNPSTGENKLFGEYLINAQGEDVVSGVRTPKSIDVLERDMPFVYKTLKKIAYQLEDHYLDMQDIEFTIEEGKLYILQTRNGKRTIQAAINIVVDFVLEHKISKEEALLRISPKQLDSLLHPTFDLNELAKCKILTKGLPASPGAATGKVYFHSHDVLQATARNESVILVRQETSPEDIEGMSIANGIVTCRGGMTSHAAVVARGMGKCCIVGCSEMIVHEDLKEFRVGDIIVKEGEDISIDGNTGNIYLSQLKMVTAQTSPNLSILMKWIDEIKTLNIRANADTKKDAITAIELGADGIGLCRTEHMFFAEDRIFEVRKMILSKSIEERTKALDHIKKMQVHDFIEILEVMNGKPCTIRLLDPPLHEFLPKKEEDIYRLSQSMGITIEEIHKRIENLKEFNPMLGHRGCRLAITYPEIYLMQMHAIYEATKSLKEKGIAVNPEIMIPLIADVKELQFIKEKINQEMKQLFSLIEVNYQMGSMIEVPRACLLADEIAKECQFFSFGTNDLTQMSYGFSRDDSHTFLHRYINQNIFDKDPFQTLDQKGVGKMIEMAITIGKRANSNLKIGLCGEHGGDPDTISYCDYIGLDYVSCSPYRIPIAKLASAQAKIKREMEKNDRLSI